MRIVEIQLSKHCRTDRELCYIKKQNKCLLYDDTAMPRELIATVSGSDLDGWQWGGDCPKLADFWQQDTHFSTWRAALMTAVTAYIN